MPFSVWLLNVNDYVLMLSMIVVFLLFSIAGLGLVRRFIAVNVAKKHNEIAGYIFATVGTLYAVLLAFVVFICWEDYKTARDNVAREQSFAVVLMRNIKAYSNQKEIRLLKEEYLRYVASVIEHEYPAMRSMKDDPRTNLLFDRLFKHFSGLQPESVKEQVLYHKIQDTLKDLSEYRALRLFAMKDEIPAPFWTVMVLGALITICFTFLFGTEHFAAHLLVSSLLAMSIAIIFYIIIALDHPFMGGISIGPAGYLHVFEIANM